MVVYKAVCIINWKGYVGQTSKSLEKRIKEHIKAMRGGSDFPFHKALRKYGPENFFWYIICEYYSQEEINEKEKYYIKYFDTKTPNGYNLTDGGEGMPGWHHTEITKQKIHNTMIREGTSRGKNNYWYGRKRPEITGDNHPCKKLDIRRKISDGNKGQIPWNKGIKTGPRPEDVCKRISKTLTGRKQGTYKKNETRAF